MIVGLVYSWVVSPTAQVETHPNLLRDDYKDIYRSLIARAYRANVNLPRAEARLELIGDQEPALALAAQAQRFLAESEDNEMALILANLSSVIQSAHMPAATQPQPSGTPTPENPDGPSETSGNSNQNGDG